jgi:hypothetical protein
MLWTCCSVIVEVAMGESFYTTIVELARIGAVGVGVAVFMMVFFMIVRGKPVDPATARLREKFLGWGVVFAFATGVLALIPPFLQKEGGPMSLRLFFSPDFDREKLTPPRVKLPDGTIAKHDEKFMLRPSGDTHVLTIAMDSTLAEVQNLRKTTTALAASVEAVEKQRDMLATQIEAPVEAQQTLETKAAESDALRVQLNKSLQAGDYLHANVLSGRLKDSVIRADRSVATIASQRP